MKHKKACSIYAANRSPREQNIHFSECDCQENESINFDNVKFSEQELKEMADAARKLANSKWAKYIKR